MQEIMERYKQELYNYHQRSRTPEAEQVLASTEEPAMEASATVQPEAAAASVSAEEAEQVSASAEEPAMEASATVQPEAVAASAPLPEPAYREADAAVPENPVDFRGNPLETAPSIVLPSVGAPVEREEEAPKEPDEYEIFKEENPGTGTLKVQVSTAKSSIPLENAAVYVTKEFNGRPRVFFSGVTNADGIVDGIQLRAPSRQESQQPEKVPPYASYDIYVDAAGYRPEEYKGVPIFDGVQSIQPVNMAPNNGAELLPEVTVEEEPDL